jgi:haloalkane dehalogenase
MIGTKPYAKLKYREVKGRQMAYIDEGEGDAIVFQHGQPASSCVWRNVMPHLERRCRLIAATSSGWAGQRSSAPRGRIAFTTPNIETIFSRSGTHSISATVYCSCWTTGALYSDLTARQNSHRVQVSFIWKPLRPL